MYSSTDHQSDAQIRTFRILKSLPKYDLLHLATEVGLLPSHYNTHAKRAAGLTIIIYQNVWITPRALKVLNFPFKS